MCTPWQPRLEAAGQTGAHASHNTRSLKPLLAHRRVAVPLHSMAVAGKRRRKTPAQKPLEANFWRLSCCTCGVPQEKHPCAVHYMAV